MKRILPCIFAAIALISCSSAFVAINSSNKSYQNFETDGHNLLWQKVYSCDDTLAVKQWLRESFVTSESGTLEVRTRGEVLPYLDAGLSSGNIPSVFSMPANTIATVEFKEDRYRVTLEHLTWMIEVKDDYALMKRYKTVTLQDFALKDGMYNGSFFYHDAEKLDKVLSYMYQVKEETNKDW